MCNDQVETDNAEYAKCALCGEYAQLKRSHVIPKFVYKRVSVAEAPLLITENGALATSRQIVLKLLCESCEQRFSRVENEIARVTLEKSEGSALDNSLIDTLKRPDLVLKLDDHDIAENLRYFATSILWRSSYLNHSDRVELGDQGEAIRQYLLGDDFPKSLFLVVFKFPESEFDSRKIASLPVTVRERWQAAHGFSCLGLQFKFLHGLGVSEILKDVSFCGRLNYRFVFQMDDDAPDYAEMLKVVATAKPLGKLKNS